MCCNKSKKFGGSKSLNTISNSHKCWSTNITECCGSTNTYIRNIKDRMSQKKIALITYDVVCNQCGNVQHCGVKKYKLNKFLKVI